LSEDQEIDLKVFYLDDGAPQERVDKGFGEKIRWDVPLLEGYAYEMLPQLRSNRKNQYGFLNPIVSGVSRRIGEGNWDGVWFHGYANISLVFGIVECVRRGIPFFFRGESNLNYSGGFRKSTTIMRWIIRYSKALLWVGTLNKEFYIHHGASPESLFFCPYTVDNDFFQSEILKAKSKESRLIHSLGIKESLPVILYSGKLMQRKNPHILLESFINACDLNKGPIGNLIFVGDGEMRQNMESVIERSKYRSYIRIMGFRNQKELPAFYGLGDLFVIPSEKEPFGLVVNEAMNGSCAIIGTNEVGSCHDLIHEGRNGYMVKAGCRVELSNKLLAMTESPSILKEMGRESLSIINGWSYKENINGIKEALEATGT